MGRVSVAQAAELLKGADDVLILMHKSPDGDTVGSGSALLRALLSLGKRARAECSDPIPRAFPNLLPEGTEEFSPKFVVSVDIADTTLFGEKIAPWADRVDLCIDHHPSNRDYAKNLLLEDDSAATCEIIFKVILELGVSITKEIADCLYTGIATDTGCFKYSNTTARSHRMAAQLIECGCEFQKINERVFDTISRQKMALEQDALKTLEFHCDNRCAMLTLTREMLTRNGAAEEDMEGISSLPRQIEGVWVGITLKENKERTGYKISMRTTEQVDASLACSKLGGGGHKRAAGCMIPGDAKNAREKILAALSDQL